MRGPSRLLVLLGDLFDRHSGRKVALLFTALTTVTSFVLDFWLATWLMPKEAHLPALFIGVMIPLVITPPIVLVVHRLIRDLHAMRRELRHQADVDGLTQVANRRHFMESADAAFQHSQAGGEPLCLLIVDLDDFKQLNDLHGHLFGDQVLREVCRACIGQLRANDLFARYGGEEFVALLPGSSERLAALVAERLRAAIESMTLKDGDGLPVAITASIGYALVDYDTSLEKLLQRADVALYLAKRSGKNQVRLATGERSMSAAPLAQATPQAVQV